MNENSSASLSQDFREAELRNVLVVIILALLVGSAWAADGPKVEVFGGYSLVRAGINGTSVTAHGWDAAVTGNLNRYFGITADTSGQYKTLGSTTLHVHNFLFGPTFSYRTSKVRPFVNALFGVADGNFSGPRFATSENVFALELGGGVDIPVARHISLRPAQLGWRRTSFAGATQDRPRYAAGIVFNLGGK